MPLASIVVPAFNVSATVSETLDALLLQTFKDFEIIVVDDGSTDKTPEILETYASDPRIRILRQRNRGLAGARNTGIDAAAGLFIGFCDADDIWELSKLEAHIEHLRDRPDVGISYSGSALIDENGADIGLAQRPRLRRISAAHILKRNPIGNGSASVIRRQVFRDIAYLPSSEHIRYWYFDETYRQSEDIECWLRIALTTDWEIEGVDGLLTRYRISAGGLSAATGDQLASWERMLAKLTALRPAFFARHGKAARAYQLRYHSRRAISDLDADRAMEMTKASFAQSIRPMFEEPIKTFTTVGAALVLRFGGQSALAILLRKNEN